MKREVFKFDILTWMFAAGANPQAKDGAEIRPSEIRGQLRWWFRALGGFKADARPVKEQEEFYFGGVGGSPMHSRIIVRVRQSALLQQELKDADALGARLNTPLGYLLFPLRSNEKNEVDASRAYFIPNDSSSFAFSLEICLRDAEAEWEDVKALVAVFGHLGALGFRSRRCMGAVAFHDSGPMNLKDALGHFKASENIVIKALPRSDSMEACVNALANWLKNWRSYGSTRMGLNESGDGFMYAKNDHDAGLGNAEKVYRAAIGLPMIQQYSSGERLKNEWTPKDGARFASPVILRPYRISEGRWLPLVVFADADAHRWCKGRSVVIKGKGGKSQSLPLSMDLYEAMKADTKLQPPSFDA